jgi:hypothetical protein
MPSDLYLPNHTSPHTHTRICAERREDRQTAATAYLAQKWNATIFQATNFSLSLSSILWVIFRLIFITFSESNIRLSQTHTHSHNIAYFFACVERERALACLSPSHIPYTTAKIFGHWKIVLKRAHTSVCRPLIDEWVRSALIFSLFVLHVLPFILPISSTRGGIGLGVGERTHIKNNHHI